MADVKGMEEMQRVAKLRRMLGLLELKASFESHSKNPQSIVLSNKRWFELSVTLNFKGRPEVANNTKPLTLVPELVTEGGLPVQGLDGEAPLRFTADPYLTLIHGRGVVTMKIHDSITSDAFQKQRMRIHLATLAHKSVPELRLQMYTEPFKVMVKVDRAEKRKLQQLDSDTVWREIRRRLENHETMIRDLQGQRDHFLAELAQLSAAVMQREKEEEERRREWD